MNYKNLMMWGVIVLLVVGLFNLFKNTTQGAKLNTIPFSAFLTEVDNGRVVEV